MVFHNSTQQKRALEQEFRTIKNRLTDAEWQLGAYDSYHPEYKDMVTQGLVGDSQRLNWLETLQDIGEEYHIPNIDFSLDSAEDADETHPLYPGSLDQLYTTQMALKLKMKHEGDLFRVFSELRSDAKGLFSVESCFLQKDNGETGSLPSVNGECELEWYGLYDVAAEEKDS